MGTRYIIDLVCPECAAVWLGEPYAPTCGITTFTCELCGTVIDLAEYTGISMEEASNRVALEALGATYDEKKNADGQD
jgi:hypothetical protein